MWVDQINEEIKNNAPSIANEKEQWKKHSIYKVPSQVTDLNEKAYKPQAISFGPYHYGEDKLKPMEEHKHRALLHFLKRCGKPIELIFQKLDQIAQELRDSYKSLDPTWTYDTSKFIEIMILDGCFILEAFRAKNYISDNDYDENDPLFGIKGQLYVMPYIMRDMLMLENQIPMTVLHTLIQVQTGDDEEDHHEWLNQEIIKMFNPIRNSIHRKLGKCMHILDVYRKSLIQELSYTRNPKPTKINLSSLESIEENLNRSAMELKEAGISFKTSETRSLKDISFNRGVLRLPTLVVNDNTEYKFLNLIAFERLHIVGTGNEVTYFVSFMDTIIDSAIDVAILGRRGILFNYLGSDEDVAKLFNSLSKEIPVDRDGELALVTRSIIYYCSKRRKRWRKTLMRTYFRNPWAIISLVAAVFLFALTIVQTGYTVAQFY